MLAAEAFDVERVAADEVFQPLERLRRADQAAGATAHHLVVFLNDGAATFRATVGEQKRFRTGGPLLGNGADDLRDYVTGALDDHRIAGANVLAFDFVGIVQGCPADHHAADGDRFERRDRRQRAGAADLDRYAVQQRLRLFGGEFMGDRPARRSADHTQSALPVDPVHLVDDTVDVVGEHGAFRRNIFIERQGVVAADAEPGQRIDGKSPRVETRQQIPMRVRRGGAGFAGGIGEKVQGAGPGDRRIQLPQAARRGVARVGENLVAFRGLAFVQGEKIVAAHIDFAAHLENFGCIVRQGLGDVGDGS